MSNKVCLKLVSIAADCVSDCNKRRCGDLPVSSEMSVRNMCAHIVSLNSKQKVRRKCYVSDHKFIKKEGMVEGRSYIC